MRSIIMMIHQNIPQLKLKTADQKRVMKIRNNAEKLSLKPNRNCLIVVEFSKPLKIIECLNFLPQFSFKNIIF